VTKPEILADRNGAIATVALSNPDKLDALTVAMRTQRTRRFPRWMSQNACLVFPLCPSVRQAKPG
jgi:enoyl-CoA hydratase/carnithine racemase